MDTLKVLEQKVAVLVGLVSNLKEQNGQLVADRDKLKEENTNLKVEAARLVEENDQIIARLQTVERSAEKGSQKLDALSNERKLTKIEVDNLIKSIDSLLEREAQL